MIRPVILSGLVALAFSSATAQHAQAQSIDDPVDAGSVVIVGEGGETSLNEGVSATAFGLQLPAGAACPGDSAHDQWRIQTFVVPSDVDPAALTYDEIGPVGDGFYALYGLDTNPIVHALTAENRASGSPGVITGLPGISFGVFPPGTLADGTYRIGVACTYFRETATYWDTEITVTADPNDAPGEMRWSLTGVASDPNATQTGSSSRGLGAWWVVAAGGLVLGLGVVVIGRRRRLRAAAATRSSIGIAAKKSYEEKV